MGPPGFLWLTLMTHLTWNRTNELCFVYQEEQCRCLPVHLVWFRWRIKCQVVHERTQNSVSGRSCCWYSQSALGSREGAHAPWSLKQEGHRRKEEFRNIILEAIDEGGRELGIWDEWSRKTFALFKWLKTISDHSNKGLPGGLVGKEFSCNAVDSGLIPGLGRSSGGGNGNYSSILAWEIPWTEKPGRL